MNSPESGTTAQLLKRAMDRGLDRLDAQLLLLHALGRPAQDRAWLLAHDTDSVPTSAQSVFDAAVMRRIAGEPVAYITGHKEFFGLDLQVDQRVLVPRPDTETLVEWALDVLKESRQASLIDLGTGSGAIALAIQHARPDLRVIATDASADALQVAQGNARRLHLSVEFIQCAWMKGVSGPFDVIVSNPPYIAAQDPHLDDLRHEPFQALASGADGLDDIRQIVTQASAHLRPGGWLLLEHGWDQAASVRQLLQEAGFAEAQSRRDLSGIERCSGGRHG
jgi:release factor glutamine methyltransferase